MWTMCITPGFEVNLLDVERVEILKGPQGTLYGRNTEAGVINVLTKQATNEWTAKVGLGYGTYNTKKRQADHRRRPGGRYALSASGGQFHADGRILLQ